MAAIYFRMKASKDAKGNWQADPEGAWRQVAVPVGRGRRPEWLVNAEKIAAEGGRGFQFQHASGTWSNHFKTVVEALRAAESAPVERAAAERGLTLVEAANPANAKRVAIKYAIATYLGRKIGKKSRATIAKYTYDLEEFAAQLPRDVKFIDQIGSEVLENFFQYLQKNGASPKTIKGKILNVCFMLKYVGVQKPSKMVELPTIEEQPVVPYTAADLKALFAAMSAEENVRYSFFLDTACREAEVAHAQWDDIDWATKEFIVRSKSWKAANGLEKAFSTKNHKSRRVPLSADLIATLRTRQKASKSVWIFPNAEGAPEGHFLRRFKKIALAAGLNCGRCSSTGAEGTYENKKRITVSCATHPVCEKHFLHRLRKTRATFLHEQKHVPVRTLQEWLGHSDLNTTQKYLGVKETARLQDEINAPMY